MTLIVNWFLDSLTMIWLEKGFQGYLSGNSHEIREQSNFETPERVLFIACWIFLNQLTKMAAEHTDEIATV